MIASVPLPPLPWSRVAEAGLVEILLEEWLLRPLQSLASVRPMAELYRLKKKIMDSPFRRKTNLTFLRDVCNGGFSYFAVSHVGTRIFAWTKRNQDVFLILSLSIRPSSVGGRSVCSDVRRPPV